MTAPLLDGLRVVEVAILAPNMVGMHLAEVIWAGDDQGVAVLLDQRLDDRVHVAH